MYIKATKEMAPNVYVSISLLQKHGNTNNDLPIRMYGTIPVGVEDPNSHLNPLIDFVQFSFSLESAPGPPL